MNAAYALAHLEALRRMIAMTTRQTIRLPRSRSPGGRAHRSWKRLRASGTRTS